MTEASHDEALLQALRARTQGRAAGSVVELGDLAATDPYGEDAFAQLARRFGAATNAQAQWVMEREPRWTPAWIGPGQEAAWLDLFEAAFGYRMDEKLRRWKYRDATHPGMGAWRDGKLIAFYGAMPRPTLYFGERVSTVQIGDVMVHPHERGVMTRSGPFQIAASTYIDRSVGFGRPHLFGFGFPTDKALQVAQKLGLYEQVDQMAELTWAPQAGKPWALRSEALGALHRTLVDRAWESMAQDFRHSVIGVRDYGYLVHRFLEHPTVHYECLVVRHVLTRRTLGVAVLRMADAQTAELMDLVAAVKDFGALVSVARNWAWAQGASGMRAWVTASHADRFASTQPRCTPMDLVVPANVWSPGPPAETLRGKWWLMAGDSDFR